MINLIPIAVILYLASSVNAGPKKAGGTTTFNLSIRPDVALRLNQMGFGRLGVEVYCRKALALTSQSSSNFRVPINPITVVTSDGCNRDDGAAGLPGIFDHWNLLLFRPDGSSVKCGRYNGNQERKRNNVIHADINGCPLYDIPIIAPLGSVIGPIGPIGGPVIGPIGGPGLNLPPPILMPSKAIIPGQQLPGPVLVPIQAPVLIPPFTGNKPVIGFHPIQQSMPIILPIPKPVIAPVIAGPIIPKIPILSPGYQSPPIHQSASLPAYQGKHPLLLGKSGYPPIL